MTQVSSQSRCQNQVLYSCGRDVLLAIRFHMDVSGKHHKEETVNKMPREFRWYGYIIICTNVGKEEFEMSSALQNIFKIYCLCRHIETDKILQFVNVNIYV